MAAINSVAQPALTNRRRRVRHKIQTPAYATFASDSKSTMLDLHEIVDISEDGVAIQCHSPLSVEAPVKLCLDLADCPEQIHTSGQVVWSNDSGRAGLRFTELPSGSLSRLREWLFVNVMAGVANSEVDLAVPFGSHGTPRPNYSDTLAGVTAVQRQVESLGPDLPAALQLVVDRAQALLRASGSAIALTGDDPDFMVCRASSGPDAPPVDARLRVGSGFSGACVQQGVLLRCDDTEVDARVDPEKCRALGIRSIIAAPIRAGEKSVGLIEAFSSRSNAFSESDERVLLRLAETVLDALNRAARAENLPALTAPPAPQFAAPQGSVLFASADEEQKSAEPDSKHTAGVSLPRSYLILLTCAAATIAMALGFLSAPLLQTKVAPWIRQEIHANGRAQLQTVLASSQPPKRDGSISADPAIETASIVQLRQMTEKGDAAAENALGLRYATGDGVTLDEEEAVRWFIKAAEQGNVSAQSKLGSIYFSGRGVPQDANRAYFWMVVANLSGDDASKALAPFVRARLTRAQVASIEQDAGQWLQQHPLKPPAGYLKSQITRER